MAPGTRRIMRITRIERQKKRGRWNVYADGEFLIGLSEDILLQFGLRVGDEVTSEQLDALARAESRTMAKRAAMRLLARRPRTIREIRDRLRVQEFSDADINTTIDDLKESGLVNDAEFAAMYIRDTLALRPMGKLLVKRKLLLHGIDKATADHVVDQAFHEHSQDDAALLLGRKYLQRVTGGSTPSDNLKVRRRLAAFLGRRGYSWETIQNVLKSLLKNSEEEGMS